MTVVTRTYVVAEHTKLGTEQLGLTNGHLADLTKRHAMPWLQHQLTSTREDTVIGLGSVMSVSSSQLVQTPKLEQLLHSICNAPGCG
jgi:hypothetical protein